VRQPKKILCDTSFKGLGILLSLLARIATFSEGKEQNFDETSNDRTKSLPPFIRHQVIDATRKHIEILKKNKGMKFIWEILYSDFVQVTVTSSLEQDVIEALATTLKLAPSITQN
jgi:hypothetical protein